ncbi:FtsX-like permease family protein [Rhodococcus aetherivorans]|uniref:ABC transporter permease n=1 Tax=Rhodococcus aetherivorans TaxID=191292 RepID=UPI002949B18D|nr:ABC transporter permease [Rhodococcus aetherivorans]MDV6294933.1 ABC transporter permease [Rhodococcus aetherivorans]
MRRLALAQARAHAGRYLSSVLAVLVAVAYVVTTLVLGDTVRAGVTDSLAAQYRGTEAVVTAPESPPAPVERPQELAARVAAVPGVSAVAVDLTASVRYTGPEGVPSYADVTSVGGDEALRWQRLADGRWPAADSEIAVGSTTGVPLGTVLTVTDAEGGEPATVTVVGQVDLAGTPQAADAAVFGTGAQVDRWAGGAPGWELRLAGDGTVTAADLVDRVSEALPGWTVRTGAERSAAVAARYFGDADLLRNVLLAFGAIAVVVSALVIANTFAVVLAARTRELALMRCVGVTAAQVRRSVLLESLLVGAVASVAGVLAGIGLAAAVVAAARAWDAPLPIGSLAVGPLTVLVGLLVGILVTVLAATGPGRAATRVAPLAALHPMESTPEPARSSWLRRIVATVGLVAGAVLLTAGVLGVNVLVACAGGLLAFVGFLAATRRIVPAVVQGAGRALARIGGPVGELAAGNAGRNPRRTAATATALILGVTLTATIVVGVATVKASAPAAIDGQFPVDVTVTAAGDEGLPAGLGERLHTIDGVAETADLQAVTLAVGGVDLRVLGVDRVDVGRTLRTDITLPGPGEIALSPDERAGRGVSAGSRLDVAGERGRRTLTVVDGTEGAPALVDDADLPALTGATRTEAVWLRLADIDDDAAIAAAQRAVTSAAAEAAPGSEVGGAVAMRRTIEQVLDTMLLVVGGLLSVAVLIALIGVGNTMALSVLERRRETGLLRAVGLGRGGIRSLLVQEALLVAGVASGLGVALGLILGVAGTASVFGVDKLVLPSVPWLQLLGIVVAGGVAGVVAALLPARRAAAVSPVEALSAG